MKGGEKWGGGGGGVNLLEPERERKPARRRKVRKESGKRRWRKENGGVSEERVGKDSREGNVRRNRKACWKEERRERSR